MISHEGRRQTRQGVMMLGMAGLVCLGGCAGPSKAQQAANQPPAFSVQTPIDRIAADGRGKAVLDRDVPGVMTNPHYELFSSMSLSQLASLSGGRLTQSKLNQVNSDLAELSPGQ
jgi:hypothetical protein